METEFQRVWNRIKAAGTFDEVTVLNNLICNELQDAVAYSRLSQRTGTTRTRKRLSDLAADERRHAKRLQSAAYMLFGGNTMPSLQLQKEKERGLEALRRRYARELEGIAAYKSAAEATAYGTLKKLYSALYAEEEKHAAVLCSLIEEML